MNHRVNALTNAAFALLWLAMALTGLRIPDPEPLTTAGVYVHLALFAVSVLLALYSWRKAR